MYLRNLLALAVGVSFLSACGGSDPTPNYEMPLPNQSPLLEVASVSVQEGHAADVVASATDSDGDIVSYHWVQISGPRVDFENGSSTISFTAPTVEEDTLLIFTVVVTDDDGGSAEETVTVTVTANMREIAISGKVTDGPIANAEVEVTIEGRTYQTTADENGDYIVDIIADDSYSNALVTIIAKGPEVSSPVKLISYLDSLENLINAAGDDGTLTKDELFAVNITNVTTAQAALMEQAHGGKIADVTSLDEALKDYDDSLLLKYATAIKLVIDYAAAYPELALPSELSDTLTLVSDPQAVANYLTNAEEKAPNVVERAQEEIISDPDLVSAGSDSIPIADTYYIIMPDGYFGRARLTLNENATGLYVTHQDEINFTWTQSVSGVEVKFLDSPVSEYSTYDEALNKNIDVQRQLVTATVNWLKQAEKADTLVWKETYQLVYPNDEKNTETSETESVLKTVKSRGLLDGRETLSLGTYYVEYHKFEPIEVRDEWTGEISSTPATGNYGLAEIELMGTIADGGNATVFISKIDGTGQITKERFSGSWSLSEDGLINISTNAEEYVFDLAVIQEKEDGLLLVSNRHSFDQAATIGGTTSTALAKSNLSLWTATQAPGIYKLDWEHVHPSGFFWVEIYEDGTALTVDISDSNENGTIEVDEIETMPGAWEIQDGGAQLTIRRYRRYGEYCEPSQYAPDFSEDCRVYHERTWSSPLITENAEGETEYHVAHLHRFYNDFIASYENWTVSPEHILRTTSFDNRHFIKTSERPFDFDTVLNP